MKKGDHIYIYLYNNGIEYTHHGIYIGDDRVIHYWKGKIRRGKVYKSRWCGKKIHVKKYKDSYDNSRVVERAKKRLGETKYHLMFNNCEHFACWCKTGKHESKQISEVPLIAFKQAEEEFKKEVIHIQKKLYKAAKIIKKIKIPKF